MGIICSIGGGEIGGFFNGQARPIETEAIDRELIALTKKQHPKVLFLPTASSDSKGYIANFTNYYTSLGCEVDTLLLHNKFADPTVLKKKIFSADLIYVGGGNTLKMLKLRKKSDLYRFCNRLTKKESFFQDGVLVGFVGFMEECQIQDNLPIKMQDLLS